MADAADNAAQVAGEAAAQTAAVVASVEASAAAAIEHAEQRIEAAQAVAEQISDAALMTALGQRVDGIQTEVQKWRSETTQKLSMLETEMTELKTQTANLATQVTEAVLKALTPPPPAAAAQPPLATPTQVVTEMPATEPVENAEAILEKSADQGAATVKAAHRRVWK